ncbi:MAG TPA: FHA domain-containing protein [Myxococcaceae bacterium]|nr:FHA domain-containing protein [Myxococcaceae bacterium]
MHVRFEARGVSSELELQPGTWTVGGGDDDGIRFPGLPPRIVELDLAEDRVWVQCNEPRPVGRARLDAGIRRWLLPGERVRLSRQTELWVQAPAETPATVALVRSLLEPGDGWAWSAAALLVCVAGADAGSVFPLAGPAPELGRLPGCAVRLGDGAVSRRHLQLVREGDRHRVRDIGGRNRARCNGRWLRSGLLLSDGDVLGVGRSLLHYRAGRGPLTASETAPPAPPAAPSDADGGRRSS